ncbi:MAG: DUF4340 domain-containing protein [Lachnospiraceae bacterium]|nr:DUF4340 domain-containing protein [Lachnospiraceae bacterium]
MKKERQKIELSSEDREVIKKQTKKLVIMGIVLVVLIAAYFILSYVITRLDKAEAEKEEEAKVFFTTDTESVSEFTYTYQDSEYSFRKEGENWIYTGDETIDIDEDILNGLIKNLASIEYKNLIEDVTDYDQYGLESGYEKVRWTNSEGVSEIRIGSKNEITGEYYIEDAGNGDVCTVNATFANKYHVTLDDVKVVEVEETETEGDTEE